MIYKSQIWQSQADMAIAHGALTNSKRPRSFVEGVYPTHFKHANKCYLYSVDDVQYIDFICGLGTNYYGYGNKRLSAILQKTWATGGSVYSFASCEEVKYAERLKGDFPFLERVRFLKSGSEGCSAAVKIARAFTGKSLVLTEGYHGWHDLFVSITPPAYGVPTHNQIEKLGDFSSVKDAACVIIEPIITDNSRERIEWLKRLKDECVKHKTILIYDETITAVRYQKRTVAQTYNILPDLWVAGKALCGGLPMSVIGGRADVMEADYFISSTWAGDRLACAVGVGASDLSLSTFRSEDLWDSGEVFLEKFNALSKHVQIVGYPTRGIFKYTDDTFKGLFMQEMAKARVLIGPTWFYNKWLDYDRDNVISIARGVINKIRDGKAKLEGQAPLSPFAEKVRHEKV